MPSRRNCERTKTRLTFRPCVSSKLLKPEEEAYIQRRSLVYINKDQGDAEDQRVAFERVLLNLGMSDLHESREAR